MLRRSSKDGLRWVAWANLFARAHPIADTGKLSLAHATHQITCVGTLGHFRPAPRADAYEVPIAIDRVLLEVIVDRLDGDRVDLGQHFFDGSW